MFTVFKTVVNIVRNFNRMAVTVAEGQRDVEIRMRANFATDTLAGSVGANDLKW